MPDFETSSECREVGAREDLLRLAEARVAHMAWHDALTGLPNRSRLREVLLGQLQHNTRGEELALMVLDLDGFKQVNDSRGHAAGDAVLAEVARRLRGCVRGSDLVARMGGDEFAIVLSGAPQPATASSLARRIIEELCEPIMLPGQTVRVGVSIGVAVAPFDGEDPDTLHRHADLALYRAKADGKATVRFFEPAMDVEVRHRRELEADLRRALERGEFELAYQAQVNLQSRRIAGFEALLRWRHPQRGTVSPLDFIPLAEEAGLIVPIGRWVLEQACREAAQWPAPLRVAVNVSAVQFRHGALLRDVLHALQLSGLDGSRLELEITESVMLGDPEHALATLRELRQRGVKVAMDDFGTGYSSLSQLRAFPFDRIKIDRSFTADIGKGGDALSIVRAVAHLGRSLGMETTVEGVETGEQLQAVQQEGCDEAQGWLFSRPVDAAQARALLARGDVIEPGDRT